MVVSQVQLQEETQERHRKTKVIVFIGPREGVTTCRTGSQGKLWICSVQGQKTGGRQELRPPCLLGFPRERQGRVNTFGWLE